MCGFIGCLHSKDLNFHINNFEQINDLLTHRGPDYSEVKECSFNNYFLKLGHKRLSIIGLNEYGNQPMKSSSGRYEIIYNGEIYNHIKLRKKIDNKSKVSWKGTCDTETLLELFENFSIDEAINNIEGMFSFLIFDKKENKIIISRDRAGEKPLYFSCTQNSLSFSSDLNSLISLPFNDFKISKKSLGMYLRHNYIPSPYTIYDNCFKLPAAKYLIFDLNNFKLKRHISFNDLINSKGVIYNSYWSLNINNHNKNLLSSNIKTENLINLFENQIEKSVEKQLISDVPLGAFLSGGIDSSLIVALMQKKQKNTKTFTIGFDFDNYDESNYANKISKHLETEHTSYNCSKKDVLNLIPNLNKAFTEPFADCSQLPTMLVSKIASNYVKVVLSGDGGDELFCGYNRYILANKYWKYIDKIPKSLLKLFSKSLLKFPYKDKRLEKILIKLNKIDSKFTFYESLTSEWDDESNIISDIPSNNLKYIHLFDKLSNLKFEDAMMYSDFNTYLPDDILCKVDRSSMFYSLEARAPFLDKDLIELAFSLPLSFKIRNGKSKWVLKKILEKYVPEKLFNRPKHGFGVPISEWMRTDLKDWVNDNLSESVCKKHNFFNYKVIEKTKKEHFNGNYNHELKLWSLLQFNQWYLENFNN